MSIKGRMQKQIYKGSKKMVLADGQGARKRKTNHARNSARHRRSFKGRSQ